MFGAVVGDREVEFSWSPPPPTQQNGVITSYTLSCSPSPSSLPQSPSSQSGSLTATSFSPNTLYSCSLTAENSQGSGPPAVVTFTTEEDFPLLPVSGSLSVTGFSPNTLYSCSLTANNSQGSGPPATYTFTTQQDSVGMAYGGPLSEVQQWEVEKSGDKCSKGFEMSLVPGSPGVIPTSTNSAYHTVKQEGKIAETYYEIPLRAGDDRGYDIILCPSPPPHRPPSQQSLPKPPESEEEVYEAIPGEDN
ncbi:hypothetical protein GBAR_LOCUS29678 [Geodia barretti]|uniref:Fibronectin type-III domain-containing protein n=1 Tax=Geodia barretti TaxID=519541 RepID=A0AA35TTX4_GEOBA|nr:hypothetical protein GBAR_LOCUS29678 [Geodia barretti]